MKICRCTFFAALVLLVGAFENLPAQALPDPALAPIAKLKAAFDANDGRAVEALFTPTAVISDEVIPYRWTGPTAALRWLHDDDAVIERNHVRDPRITLGNPMFVHRSAASVYTVLPLVDAYVVGNHRQRETGLVTIVLVKRASSWKISLLAFAKQSDTSDSSWK